MLCFAPCGAACWTRSQIQVPRRVDERLPRRAEEERTAPQIQRLQPFPCCVFHATSSNDQKVRSVLRFVRGRTLLRPAAELFPYNGSADAAETDTLAGGERLRFTLAIFSSTSLVRVGAAGARKAVPYREAPRMSGKQPLQAMLVQNRVAAPRCI